MSTSSISKRRDFSNYLVQVIVYLVNEYTEFQTMEHDLIPLFYNPKELNYDLCLYWLSHRMTEEAFDYITAIVEAKHKVTIVLPELSVKFEIADNDSLYAFIDYLMYKYDYQEIMLMRYVVFIIGIILAYAWITRY